MLLTVLQQTNQLVNQEPQYTFSSVQRDFPMIDTKKANIW